MNFSLFPTRLLEDFFITNIVYFFKAFQVLRLQSSTNIRTCTCILLLEFYTSYTTLYSIATDSYLYKETFFVWKEKTIEEKEKSSVSQRRKNEEKL